MKIEYLNQTTLLIDVCSPIDFESIDEHNDSIARFSQSVVEEHRSITINEITPTDNLRIILKGEISDSDAQELSKFSSKYKKVLIVSSTEIENHDYLKLFGHLYGFQISNFDKGNSEILDQLPRTIKELSVGFAPNKSFSLEPFLIFKELTTLRLQGKIENIELIAQLSKIEILDLSYMHVSDFSAFTRLKNLKQLFLRHGGVSDFSKLAELIKLESLYLWKVKGLTKIIWLNSLTHLKRIEVGALSKVENLPTFENLKNLEYVKFEQMNGLDCIANIARAPNVKTVHISQMNKLPLTTYESFIDHLSLKELTTGYSSKKKRKTI